MIKSVFKKMLSWLPYNKYGDSIYYFIMFFYAQKRFPSKKKILFNDFLYFHKQSKEFTDVYTQITSDKELAKVYARNIIPQNCLPKTFLITNSMDELKSFRATYRSVVKPAHLFGSVVFLEEGECLSKKQLIQLELTLKQNVYFMYRERNYRFLKPKIIVEECILDNGQPSNDYKIYCYEGKPKIIQVDANRQTNHIQNFYDTNWNETNISYVTKKGFKINKPENLEKMLEYAELLAQNFKFVRVDFYKSAGQIYLGELTHCPNQAHGRFESIEDELRISKYIFN